MDETPKKVEKIGRFSLKGWLGFSSALVVALGLIALVLMVEVSSQPKFCGTCHVMWPFYDSWATSTHSDVACVDCHIPPGVAHAVRKKFEALSMVASYFTATYGTRPWAEIDDSACLRCHERRLLSSQELLGDVLFDHAPHLTYLRREKRLRCTSCHSQIVQGEHMAVTSSTCILCHFKGQDSESTTAQCELCHTVPNKIVKKGLMTFDHGDVKRFDMNCRWCHTSETISSTGGGVPPERCRSCHTDAERTSLYDDSELMHRVHVTDHKVDCMNCHTEIKHGGEAQAEPEQNTCERCHSAGHSPQSDLYAGIGGRGVPPMEAPMSMAGVACEGCHLQVPGHETRTAKATEVSCMSCHGPRYRSVFYRWKRIVEERSSPLRRQLQATSRLFSGQEPQGLMDARHNLELVEQGRGVHNVRYAFALLAKSHDYLNEARNEAGHSALSLPWPEAPFESPCMQCHQGIESQSGTAFGRPFDHRRHVVGQRLECERCHLPHELRPPGQVLSISASDCNQCHHREVDADCQKCHQSVLSRQVSSFRGGFSHEVHVSMGNDCGDCHRFRPGQPVLLQRETCAECHG